VEAHLIQELEAILKACRRRGIGVYVIGAFGVRAYGSLLRRTLDLDLAVERADWPVLAEILEARGYHLQPVGVWITAQKGEGEEKVELEVALADRLAEVEEMLKGGEVEAIWWDRLGLMLDESERQVALEVVGHLQARGG
jgi:hypothetical protein